MKLQALHETIDNLFTTDTDKRQRYAEQVFDILQQSYAGIGGVKSKGFESPQAMVDYIPMWKLFRRGDQVKAVMMYKDTAGRKRVAIGTDGSMEGKSMLAKMLTDEILSGRAFAEISGPSLRFHEKILGDALNDYAVPAKKVKNILPMKEIRLTDDPYKYERLVDDTWVMKMLVGKPYQTIR